MPEAILLEDVEELGEQGTAIDVSKGYLRNYLIPRKLAQPATKGAIEAIRERKAAAERAELGAIEKAQENVNLLNRTVLTIPQQAGADGRLFGSVTAQDIASLSKFISEKGKIRSRRITGSCRRHQSQIARAVKRARELALLPYVNEGGREDSPRGGRGDRDRDRER